MDEEAEDPAGCLQQRQEEAEALDRLMEEEDKDAFQEEERAGESFLQPSSKSRFTLRKRKRRPGMGANEDASDSVSVCSFEMDTEPDVKKKKALPRISSLSTMLATPLGRRVEKMGSALQKSLSVARLSPAGSMRTPSKASLARSASTVFGEKEEEKGSGRTSPGSQSLSEPQGWASSPFRRSSVHLARKNSGANLTPYKPPVPTPGKGRPTRYWTEVYSSVVHKLSQQELKLQEAVFEMFNGEDDLVEDLKLVRKTYADSLIHLNILKPAEERLVFGHMSALTPVHQLFHAELKRAQCKDGFWFSIGPAVEKWIRTVEGPYVNYCSNLLAAKTFLDKKQAEDKAFNDFLQRCIESPFSRKLDLWSFLDVPRSRLVKYPLLLKQVLKYSEDSDDIATITATLAELDRIIGLVDAGMAGARCAISVSSMEFMTSEPPACVAAAREEILSGVLRNSRGTKVSVYLLDSALVVGRLVTRSGVGQVVQVFREPVETHRLEVVDLSEGEIIKPGSFHRPGSFKGAVFNSSGSKAVKNAFRLNWSPEDGEKEEKGEDTGSITLVAGDEHTKRQWVSVLQKAIASAIAAQPASPVFDLVDALNNTKPPTPRKPDLPKAAPRAKLQKKFAAASKLRSTPRLLSASRLLSPTATTSSTSRLAMSTTPTTSGRLGVFKKNKSPVIKSSLSQSALGKIQAGRVSKLRLKVAKNDENVHRGAVVAEAPKTKSKSSLTDKNRSKSSTVMQTLIKGKARGEKRLLQLINENTKPISRSMAHLVASPTSSPRYLTRRAAKLSKSMNDLLVM